MSDTFSTLSISGYGMRAQSERVRVIAQNIANSDTAPLKPGENPYTRQQITFKNELDRKLGEKLVKVEAMFGRHTFWTMVRARWLPIPFPVFNFAAALVDVPLGRFLGSSAVGLLIPVGLNTFLWAGLVEATGAERTEQIGRFAFFMVALFALSMLPGWLARRKDARAKT